MRAQTGILALVTSVLVMAACGGGNNNSPDAGGIIVNPPDAALLACDPLAQAGCDQGEKCTWVDEAGASSTRCVPDGTVNLGEPCLETRDGDADDCKAGLYCVNGGCVGICSPEEATCGLNERCGPHGNVFADALGAVGVCRPVCDPTFQNCSAGEACYLIELDGTGACALVPEESKDRVQDDTCLGPAEDVCYANGCARGFGTFLLGTECLQICTPAATGVGMLDYIQGNPNGTVCGQYHPSAALDGAECRFLNFLLGGAGVDMPDAVGVCITATYRAAHNLGSCTTHQLNAAYTLENVEAGIYVPGCEGITDTIPQ